jgi:hypothetical protein
MNPHFRILRGTQETGQTLRLHSDIAVNDERIKSAQLGALVLAECRTYSMLGAGIEPAWEFVPRDFKSLASTDFATRA